MKKLSFLQAYEKHIEKAKKHGLTIASVLAVGVIGSLGYQGYQDASYAKAIANKELLQDMGFVRDTRQSINDNTIQNLGDTRQSIKDQILIAEDPITLPSAPFLTGVYTGGDIIISAASFTQTLPNGTVGPINTIISTGSNAPVTVNITFKNIGTMPLYIPNEVLSNNSKNLSLQYKISGGGYYGGGNGGGSNTIISSSTLTQGNYLMPGSTIQSIITLNTDINSLNQFHNSCPPKGKPYIKLTVQSQQQLLWSPVQTSQYQTMLFEDNGENNTFNIYYDLKACNPISISTGILEPIGIESPIGIVRKGFDLKFEDVSATYNTQTNRLTYNLKVRNVGNKKYIPNLTVQSNGTSNADRIAINKLSTNGQYMLQGPYNCNIGNTNGCEDYLSQFGYSLLSILNPGEYQSFSFQVEPTLAQGYSLSNGNYSIAHVLSIGSLSLINMNSTNILPNDINNNNNIIQFSTPFTVVNGTNPTTGSGNTYGYGYGYQPGYGYGYGYGYKTQYASKSNFFYLTKPYMMISEKVYKVFKDQYTVMKKLKKGAVEKLFDKSTLKTMRIDITQYLKKEINKAQNKTKGMREKIAEIQKLSKLYTQFTKDYSKRISSKK